MFSPTLLLPITMLASVSLLYLFPTSPPSPLRRAGTEWQAKEKTNIPAPNTIQPLARRHLNNIPNFFFFLPTSRASKPPTFGHNKRLLSSESASPPRLSSVLDPRAVPSPGAGELARIPAHALGHSPARPAPPPRDEHPPTGPRCPLAGRLRRRGGRAANSPELSPSAPPHPKQAPPRNTGMEEYKEPSHTPKGLGDFPRGRTI
ncbi:extensin-like [Zalophus californianus]|uniref:Extensin-like n=1 Tax=Zalophus californianus TaxID=9704 RepID=A0A6J2CQ83_ZALCA|nr:extensin-like [Zalophus californianus]